MSAGATPTPTLTPGPLWVNDHNYGPLVNIITWFLLITSFLSVAARVGTRLAVVKRVYADDMTIMCALLLSIGQSICVSMEVTHGLGKPTKATSHSSIEHFQKELFASNILYVAIVTLIKISVCLYLTGLTPVRLQKTIVLVVGSFIIAWGASAIIVLGFQCDLPHTWDALGGKCINHLTFWTYVNVMNIVTDLPLIILPALIVSRLHADTGRKAIVIACFASRILVIGGSVAQIYYLHRDFSVGDDYTFQIWRSVMCTEVVIFLSLLTANIPYLKLLIEAMEHGMIRADDLRRRGVDPEEYGGNQSNDGEGGSRGGSRWGKIFGSNGGSSNASDAVSSKKAMRLDNLSSSSSHSMHMPHTGRMLNPQSGKHHTNTTISGGYLGHKSGHKSTGPSDDDGNSQSSQSKIIKKTMTFNVSEEPPAEVPDYINGRHAT